MFRYILVVTSCAAVLTVGSYVQGSESNNGHSRTVCPKCKSCCTLKVERGMKDRSRFDVECKEICIPRVVFPWQKWLAKRKGNGTCGACGGSPGGGGCDSCSTGCESCGARAGTCGECSSVNNGARVKTVKRLKKTKYECPTCKYEWTPAGSGGVICGGVVCGGANCGNVNCGNVNCGSAANACESGYCDATPHTAPAAQSDAEEAAQTQAVPRRMLDVQPVQPLRLRSTAPVQPIAKRTLTDE